MAITFNQPQQADISPVALAGEAISMGDAICMESDGLYYLAGAQTVAPALNRVPEQVKLTEVRIPVNPEHLAKARMRTRTQSYILDVQVLAGFPEINQFQQEPFG